MKWTIEAWKDHHYQWDAKSIKNLGDLYNMIYKGEIWGKETDEKDEKITITIETEDE